MYCLVRISSTLNCFGNRCFESGSSTGKRASSLRSWAVFKPLTILADLALFQKICAQATDAPYVVLTDFKLAVAPEEPARNVVDSWIIITRAGQTAFAPIMDALN